MHAQWNEVCMQGDIYKERETLANDTSCKLQTYILLNAHAEHVKKCAAGSPKAKTSSHMNSCLGRRVPTCNRGTKGSHKEKHGDEAPNGARLTRWSDAVRI